MGTRSKLIFHDTKNLVDIYKHYDGYMSETLPLITNILKKMDTLGHGKLRDCLDIFSDIYSTERKEKILEIKEIPFSNEFFKHKNYQQHGDLEYVYIIDIKNRTLDCFTGHGCEYEIIAKKHVSIVEEVSAVREESREEIESQLLTCLTELESINYKFNTSSFDLISASKKIVDKEKYLKENETYEKLEDLKVLVVREKALRLSFKNIDSKILREILKNADPENTLKISTIRKGRYDYFFTLETHINFGHGIFTNDYRSSNSWEIEYFCKILGLTVKFEYL